METELFELRLDAFMTQAEASRFCRVSVRTWRRWECGRTRPPHAVLELLRLRRGDLSPLGWPGWRLGHDGLLYHQDRVQGFTQSDIRRIWWDRQALDDNRIQLRGLRSDLEALKKENKRLRERLAKHPEVIYRCPLQAPQAQAG